MKKCSSCTKDLPDAALHCVFCGAKQAPVPATQGGLAKTVMGHGGQEMIEQLRQAHAQAQGGRAQQPQPPAQPQAYPPPQAQPPFQPPRPQPAPGYPPHPGQAPQQPPHGVPSAGSVAPTMFVPGSGPQPPFQPANQFPSAPMPPPRAPAPMPPPAMDPMPARPQPYLSQTPSRAMRPVEPWKDTLRTQMLIWGIGLIVAFVVPVAIDPLGFQWDAIIHGEGLAKVPPLLIAVIGALSLILAVVPSSPPPRGLLAAILGFLGIAAPLVIALSAGSFGIGQILAILSVLSTLLLVPGLLIRNEYTDSIAGRLLTTFGVLLLLGAYLTPVNDNLLLVSVFEALLDAPGAQKVSAILMLLPLVLALASLLVWIPGPGTAGAGVLAWLWIALPGVAHFTRLIVAGNIGAAVKGSPNHALLAWVPETAYLVLLAFGLATVIGKKLES